MQCTTFTTLTVNIVLCVCVLVGMPTRGQKWNPTGRTQRVWARGAGSQFDMINRVQQGTRDQNPVCPQFIAKANPISASKLAFVVWYCGSRANYRPHKRRAAVCRYTRTMVTMAEHVHIDGFRLVVDLTNGKLHLHGIRSLSMVFSVTLPD